MSMIIQQLDQAEVMLTNALNETLILQRLSEVGYTEAKIRLGLSTVAGTRTQVKAKQEAYTTQKLISRQASTEMASLRRMFSEHRSVARLAFRHQPEQYAALQLDVPLGRKQPAWLEQAVDFYAAILPQAKVMQRYDVPKTELEQTQSQLQSVRSLRMSKVQKKGKAQHSTQQRNKALKELNQWLVRFRAAARLALADDPQLLEVLGIVVTA